MQTQEEFNKIMDGMEEVNREMARQIEAAAPICHFTPMSLDQSDSVDGYYEEWWVCCHCGHTKEL